MIVNCSSLS